MNGRLKVLGVIVAIMGLAFIAGGGFAYYKTSQGSQALQAFSAAQNVKLTYNADGQLADASGKTEEATAIMGLLTNDWGFSVDKSELNPNDPLVNTTSEYMYQMATVTYHTLHAATTVVLDKDVTAADGTVYTAGSHEFQNDGRYWTGFDRTNPIEAAARGQIWTPTALALVASSVSAARPPLPCSSDSAWPRSSVASASCSSSPASAWCGWPEPRPKRSRPRSSARRPRSPRP